MGILLGAKIAGAHYKATAAGMNFARVATPYDAPYTSVVPPGASWARSRFLRHPSLCNSAPMAVTRTTGCASRAWGQFMLFLAILYACAGEVSRHAPQTSRHGTSTLLFICFRTQIAFAYKMVPLQGRSL
jgi:hypothetical protein